MFRCFSSYKGLAVLGIAVLLGGYLTLWHGQHLAALAPILVLLACPLMHIFMHGSHAGSHTHSHHSAPDVNPANSPEEKIDAKSQN